MLNRIGSWLLSAAIAIGVFLSILLKARQVGREDAIREVEVESQKRIKTMKEKAREVRDRPVPKRKRDILGRM